MNAPTKALAGLGTMAVAALLAVGVLGVPATSASASDDDNRPAKAVVKREDHQGTLALVADGDDSDDDDAPGASTRTRTRGNDDAPGASTRTRTRGNDDAPGASTSTRTRGADTSGQTRTRTGRGSDDSGNVASGSFTMNDDLTSGHSGRG